ncbi:MAG: hypothetical protein IT349_17145 [Candidatus Eisenbacteria bacterium]|nr:hypothetical protein [Candidatus Eisenbacteria bacterium]
MDGLRFGQGGDGKGSLRGLIVVLITLPTAIVGLIYFLFVEYVGWTGGEDSTLVLRLGGATVILLGLVLGITCGYLLSEKVIRPIRLLIRLADPLDTPPARSGFLHHLDWEIFDLYRRVKALVQQNRAGARAVQELEDLRQGIGVLRHELTRRGQHGILPAANLPSDGVWGEIGASLEENRGRSLSFLAELRERARHLHEAVEQLGPGSGPEVPVAASHAVADRPSPTAAGANPPPVRRIPPSAARVRQTGTVLALETERLSTPTGHAPGAWLERFDADMRRLEEDLVRLGRSAPGEWGGAVDPGEGVDPEGGDAVLSHAVRGDAGPSGERELRTERWNEALRSIDALERRLREVESR